MFPPILTLADIHAIKTIQTKNQDWLLKLIWNTKHWQLSRTERLTKIDREIVVDQHLVGLLISDWWLVIGDWWFAIGDWWSPLTDIG